MLVGDPSDGKSPALDAVLDPLKQIDSALAESHKASKAEWDRRKEVADIALADWKAELKAAIKNGKHEPERPKAAEIGPCPVRERVRIADITVEKLAELLAATWRGLLLTRDELFGWLNGMDRYNGGGDREFWIEAFGGRSYTVDRKSVPEPIIIDYLSIAVLGGTQPDKLNRVLVNSDDDGLLARFLIAFPEPVSLKRPTVKLDAKILLDALENLRKLQPPMNDQGLPRPFLVKFSDDAADALQTFRVANRNMAEGANSLFKGHVGKQPGMVVRVACVLAHLDWAYRPTPHVVSEIQVDHVDRAVKLVGQHFYRHAYKAYGASNLSEEVRNANRIGNIILQERPERVTVREIQKRGLSGLDKAQRIEMAMRVLEDLDWVCRVTEQTGGRPRTIFRVNPKLFNSRKN